MNREEAIHKVLCQLSNQLAEMGGGPGSNFNEVESSLKAVTIEGIDPQKIVGRNPRRVEVLIYNASNYRLHLTPFTGDISRDLYSLTIKPEETFILNSHNYQHLYKSDVYGFWGKKCYNRRTGNDNRILYKLMSRILDKFGEPFKMRVVSGMMVDGAIRISWATGEKASSQMDWGLDPNNLATTPEYHREPADMVRYHTLYFPVTYLDAEHFFRVRSKTASGKVGESPIYSVITPAGINKSVDSFDGEIELEIRQVQVSDIDQELNVQEGLTTKTDPTSSGSVLASDTPTSEAGISETDGATSSNADTNPITTVA